MALQTMREMLKDARRGHYAVGAFEYWSFESAYAIVEAAEKERMPVILQTGYDAVDLAGDYERAYEVFGKIGRHVAEQAKVPVAIHLDHGIDLDEVQKALDGGFTSVMIDSSALPFEQNVETTIKAVEMAKRYGASVESELGRLGGNEGSVDVDAEQAAQTDPTEAEKFVQLTGIDALAVAIGTVHGVYKFKPRINIERLKQIADKVELPLVLHGGSGTPVEKVLESISNGIAKVNICTEFLIAIGEELIRVQKQDGFKYGMGSLFNPGKNAGSELVRGKIALFKNGFEGLKL